MCDSVGMIKLDMSDWKPQMKQITVNTRWSIPYSMLHPGFGASLKSSKETNAARVSISLKKNNI